MEYSPEPWVDITDPSGFSRCLDAGVDVERCRLLWPREWHDQQRTRLTVIVQ